MQMVAITQPLASWAKLQMFSGKSRKQKKKNYLSYFLFHSISLYFCLPGETAPVS